MSKTIVITGGTSGIGLGVAEIMRTEGHNIVIIDRSADEAIENHFKADVTDEARMREVFNKIAEKHPQIDVLLNCAGYGLSGAVELVEASEVRRHFDVNVVGSVNAYKFAIPHMKKGAKVINLASAAALNPLPFRGFYSASKAAINTLSMSERLECKSFGVEVVSLCPGDTKTNFNANRVSVLTTNERYGDSIARCVEHLNKKNDSRMPVGKVTKRIIKVINKKKNKPLIIIGTKERLFHFLCRFLPISAQLWVLDKLYSK